MTYYVFDRDSAQLEGIYDRVPEQYLTPRYLVLCPDKRDQTSFRKQLDSNKVSRLEVAVMYRNAGNVTGPISRERDTLISDLYYMLTTGKPRVRNVIALLEDEHTGTKSATATQQKDFLSDQQNACTSGDESLQCVSRHQDVTNQQLKGNIMATTEMTAEQIAAAEAEKQAKEQAKAEAKAAKEAAAAQKKADKEAEKEAAKAKREAEKAAKEQAKLDAKAAKEAAKMPEQNDVRRPAPDTACGEVWATADALSTELGQPVPIANLLKAFEGKATSDSTVRTQYARWKKFHGLTGRITVGAGTVVEQAAEEAPAE